MKKSFITVCLFCCLTQGVLADATSAQPPAGEPVLLGIDVLEKIDFAPLKGKQIGLITNQTGVDSNGRSTADILVRAPGVKLVALFSPEHGIRGQEEGGRWVGDAVDRRTHLPVYSLYGTVQRPTPEMLNAIDVLVFDMQDVGVRFYTYLTTMGMAMEAAAQRKIEFVVLDRPNPLGGTIVEGQTLDPRIRHFTAYYSVPARHGLTAGEMARFYNETARLQAKLTVISMTGWKRSQFWEDTGLTFTPPSPNVPTPTAALLYSGMGMFESTNVSVGRGADTPFERVGAPWMNGAVMARRLNQLNMPGVLFFPTIYEPESDLYAGQLCSGIRMKITNSAAVRPVDIFVQIAILLRELSPRDFQPRWDELVRMTGSRDFETMYKFNRSADEILSVFHKSAEQFLKDRQPYLLY